MKFLLNWLPRVIGFLCGWMLANAVWGTFHPKTDIVIGSTAILLTMIYVGVGFEMVMQEIRPIRTLTIKAVVEKLGQK